MDLNMDDVNIRLLKVIDAYTSVKWRNDPLIWEGTISSPDRIIKIEDELNWIKKVIAEKNSVRFAIEYRNKYVGNVQLTEIKGKESYCGIFIGEISCWGKGVATKALSLLLIYALCYCFLLIN